MKLNRHRCFVCERKSVRNKIALHRFPNKPELYLKWKKFCSLALPVIREEDDFRKSYLCSKHFKPSDYRKGPLSRLKHDAFPSIIHNQDVSLALYGNSNKKSSLTVSISDECSTVVSGGDALSNDDSHIVMQQSESIDVSDEEMNENLDVFGEVPMEKNRSIAVDTEGLAEYCSLKNFDGNMQQLYTLARKRKIYMGDYSASDLCCPRYAISYFNLTNSVMQCKNRMIKSLLQKCSRLQKRVKINKQKQKLVKTIDKLNLKCQRLTKRIENLKNQNIRLKNKKSMRKNEIIVEYIPDSIEQIADEEIMIFLDDSSNDTTHAQPVEHYKNFSSLYHE